MNYIEQLRNFSKNSRLFLVSNVLNSVGLGSFFVLFNLYLQSMGIGTRYIGAINSSFSLSIALFAYFSGIISDKIGRKLSFISGSSVGAIAFLFLVIGKNPSVLVAAAFVMGGANSLFVVSENPFLMESSSEFERTSLFSLSMTTLILGEFIGSLLGGFLPKIFGGGVLGMQRSLYISFTLVATALIPLFFINENWEPLQHKGILSSLKAPFDVFKRHKDKISVVAIFVSAQFLIGFGAGFVVPFFNLYFKNRFHLSTEFIGIIFSIGSVVIALGTLISPLLRKKFGRLKGVVFTQSLSLPFILILAFTRRVYIAVISYLFRGMIMNAAVPMEMQLYMESIPDESRAAMSSFMQIAWNFSWGIASAVSGFLMAKYGFSLLFILMFVFYISGMSVLYFGLKGKVND